jgi:flagellar biosynthetic protein FlhB
MKDDAQERSHQPTEQRRKKFREKGEIPRSREVTAVVGLAVAALALSTTTDRMGTGMRDAFAISFASMRNPVMDRAAAVQLAGEVAFTVFGMLSVPIFILWLGALLVGLIQGRGVIPKEPIKLDFTKLNPLPGAKRLFMSSTPLVELVKSLFKLGLIGWLVWGAAEEQLGLLPELAHVSVWTLLDVHGHIAILVLARAMPVAILIAIIDYGHQWWMLHEKMMMTREEVKEENRDLEGDPHLRAARKARQREIASVKSLSSTKRADVVVTNPTHYAVALRYRTDEAPAPVVICKGVDHLALKIKQEARRHDIPVIENRSLARALYASGKEGQMIPDDLYAAVAHVLAVILRRRGARARRMVQRRPPPGTQPRRR